MAQKTMPTPAVTETPAVPPVPAAAPAAPAIAPATVAKTKEPRVAPILTAVSSAVPMPTNVSKRGRGGNSIYPFEALEVGQSFGIANKSAKSIASVVNGANKRFEADAVDAAGNPVFKVQEIKQADGTVINVPTLEREKMPGRVFIAADVDPNTDPDKASVRVWRKQ
ncbi:hypothetical protein HUU40_00125 [candidate division KSB1 bacterium]|nr:hypothetical protein [candidate division KSB1 bacterium]